MCCLFGLIDYRHHLTGRKKSRIISILASACEIAEPMHPGCLQCGRDPADL